MSLLDLFQGRRQLLVYRAFFEPGVSGWPERACIGCSTVADQVAHPAHLNVRDTSLAFVSRAPRADIERIKTRMGWEHIGDVLPCHPRRLWEASTLWLSPPPAAKASTSCSPA
jgi:predicted dithiol-disulfide oxidoreductase (DUF899 family)